VEEDEERAGGGERVECDGVPCGVTYAVVCNDSKLRESCVEGKIPFLSSSKMYACTHIFVCVFMDV
jgi:hypothetical protein